MHQSLKIKDTLSDKVTLSYGVSQSSVVGPVFFYPIHYTTQRNNISSFDINYHFYDDINQIYMSLSVANAKEFLEKLQDCFNGHVGLDNRV